MVIPVYMGESRTELTRGHKRSTRLISFVSRTIRSGVETVCRMALNEPATGYSLCENLLYRRNQREKHHRCLAVVLLVGDRDIV